MAFIDTSFIDSVITYTLDRMIFFILFSNINVILPTFLSTFETIHESFVYKCVTMIDSVSDKQLEVSNNSSSGCH